MTLGLKESNLEEEEKKKEDEEEGEIFNSCSVCEQQVLMMGCCLFVYYRVSLVNLR